MPEEVPDTSQTDSLAHKRGLVLDAVKHNKPLKLPVRDFLSLWRYQKRGSYILRTIEKELRERNLVTTPEVAKADYYGYLSVLDCRDLTLGSDVDSGWAISTVLDPDQQLVFVGPDEPLAAAETLMVMHDYSQIPVLSKSKRELYGAVTWKSLARREFGTAAVAKHAMEIGIARADSNDSLLNHIGAIIEKERLLIRDPTRVYVGILTAADLAQNFQSTSLPFIKLGEIERRLRLIINRLPLPVLQAAELSVDSSREIRDASDLNLGEITRILQQEENWKQLNIPYHRNTILKNLDEVREIRNDVVHFRPNLDVQTSDAIDWCLNWIRSIPTT